MAEPIKKYQKVSILGCGWFGFAFAKELIKKGYSVKGFLIKYPS